MHECQLSVRLAACFVAVQAETHRYFDTILESGKEKLNQSLRCIMQRDIGSTKALEERVHLLRIIIQWLNRFTQEME